ncbi:MAG: hypothetical protein ABMA14_26705 [Hyphomonadaceae bacterium]
MTAFILAIVAGLIGSLPQILTLIERRVTDNRRKADALANLELQQTQDAMAAVDVQLDGVQPPDRQPVLLSPDDHL